MTSEAWSVLIVDDSAGGLGEAALRLIRLGLDGFYAADTGEAWLLAKQEAQRIRLVMLAPGVDLRELARITSELASKAPEVPRALLVTGPRPDDERRAELRKAGVCWGLWEPWDESALRMALSGAMAGVPESEYPERLPRFPTTLLGRAFKGIMRRDGVVSSLSEGGAFLETAQPFEQGTPLTVEIAVEGGSIVGKAEVVYCRGADEGQATRPAGMGLAFGSLPARSLELLQRTLAEHQRRFEV